MPRVIYLCLLLSLISCAKKKQGITCANPDPVTGACLRDDDMVVDPIEDDYVPYSQQEPNTRYEQQETDGLGETSTTDTTTEAEPPLSVDKSKAPAVTLILHNPNNEGVRPTFTFAHTDGVTNVNVSYGGEGNTHVFTSSEFAKGITLLDVQIPIALSFTFSAQKYCASSTLKHDFFEKGRQAMQVIKCQ